MYKRETERVALALLVGASLLLASCGGGGDSDSPSTDPGTEQPVDPTPGGETPPPVDPGPGGETPPPVDPGPGGITLPPLDPNGAFQAASDDLPAGISKVLVYPTKLIQVEATYTNTPVSGPGNYLDGNGVCSQMQSPPTDTYPNGLITLPTVNLDVNKLDDCEPEIKIQLRIDQGTAGAAEMRLRGNTTRYADQKSYRIRYASKADSWNGNGERTLQFNKHPWDLSRVRNKLAFDLMSLVPHHPSLSTQFGQITYVGGDKAQQSLGLFTHVEKMDANYLKRRNLVAGSNIYKAENFTFSHDADLVLDADGKPGPRFEQVLEIESDSKDHRAILSVTDKLSDGSMLDRDDQQGQTYFANLFNTHFNRNNYLAWFSSLILIGNYDSIEKNFALYQPLGTEKFYFLPWDYDDSLGFPNQKDVDPDSTRIWQLGIGNWWGHALHRNFLRQPGNIALLEKAVAELREKYLTDQNLKRFLDYYKPTVEPLVLSQPDLQFLPVSGDKTQAWQSEYDRLATVIGANYEKFLESLNRPMPFTIYPYQAGGKLVVDWTWPKSFHPRGEKIRHSIEIAKRVAGQAPFAAGTVVQSKTVVDGGEFEVPGQLVAAEYLIRVLAVDEHGRETPAFDSYLLGAEGQGSMAGVMCFDLRTWSECS